MKLFLVNKVRSFVCIGMMICSHFPLLSQESLIEKIDNSFLNISEYLLDQNHNYSAINTFTYFDEDFTNDKKIAQCSNEEYQEYYTIILHLLKQDVYALTEAKHYIINTSNAVLSQRMLFYYYNVLFLNKAYQKIVNQEAKLPLNIKNLSNSEIVKFKFIYGYSLYVVNKKDEAKKQFNAIVQISIKTKYTSEALFYYGLILFNEKQYDSALKVFNHLSKHPIYAPEVPYYIALIYYFLGEDEKAESVINNALRSYPYFANRALSNRLLAIIYYGDKNYAKALVKMKFFFKEYDKPLKYDYYLLGLCYYKNDSLHKASQNFKVLNDPKDSVGAYAMYMLGDCYLQLDMKNYARNAFLFCSRNTFVDTIAVVGSFLLGKLSADLGQVGIAKDQLEHFISKYPDNALANEAKEILGQLLANSNNYEKAYHYLKSLKHLSPLSQKLYNRILFGRAIDLYQKKKTEESKEFFTEITKQERNDIYTTASLFILGKIYYEERNYPESIRYYNTFITNKSRAFSDVYSLNKGKYNLAYSYFENKEYPKALKYFSELTIDINPLSEDYIQDSYIKRGDCLFMMKKFIDSKKIYKSAEVILPKYSDYAIYQIAIIEGLNDIKKKIKILQKLVDLYPNSTLLFQCYLEIGDSYMYLEQYSDAIIYYDKILNNKQFYKYHPTCLLQIGLANYNEENYKNAKSSLTTLLKKFPLSKESNQAILILKEIFIKLGTADKFNSFVQSYGKNLSSNEEDSLLYLSGEYEYNLARYERSIDRFKTYLSKYPKGIFALQATYYLAESYNFQKRWELAFNSYKAVVDIGESEFKEQALIELSKISIFKLNDCKYGGKVSYELFLNSLSSNSRIIGLRGQLYCYYKNDDWQKGIPLAKILYDNPKAKVEDKVLASFFIGKEFFDKKNYTKAITFFDKITQLSPQSELASEASYFVAKSYFEKGDITDAEKYCYETIEQYNSITHWVERAYILLIDIYVLQKDFFNAKATLISIIDNTKNFDFKSESEKKLKEVEKKEKQSGLINTEN